MKTTVLIFALLISVSGVSQVLHSKDQKFVRVYDHDGNKIRKGKLYSVSDSTLTIMFRESLHNIPVADLGTIKFKRSIGSSALTGSLIGGGIGAIVGGASADPDPDSLFGQATVAEGVVSGFILGLPVGAAVGGLTGLLRKKREIYINGDLNTWMTFKNNLLEGSL